MIRVEGSGFKVYGSEHAEGGENNLDKGLFPLGFFSWSPAGLLCGRIGDQRGSPILPCSSEIVQRVLRMQGWGACLAAAANHDRHAIAAM